MTVNYGKDIQGVVQPSAYRFYHNIWTIINEYERWLNEGQYI